MMNEQEIVTREFRLYCKYIKNQYLKIDHGIVGCCRPIDLTDLGWDNKLSFQDVFSERIRKNFLAESA